MIQKSAATQAGILFLMTLIIAGVLEAVARISNLLNQPINPMLLAAGAISAAVIWGRRGG
jgi:2-keto-4-pentenoate hydratase